MKKEINNLLSNFHTLKIDTDNLGDTNKEILKSILSRRFMSEYTLYDSTENFFRDSPSNISDYQTLEKEEFEGFICNNTVFDTWNEMKTKSIEEWIASNSRF